MAQSPEVLLKKAEETGQYWEELRERSERHYRMWRMWKNAEKFLKEHPKIRPRS